MNSKSFTLFLPAFIGVSPKEGSGLYDPVIELGISHEFYKVTEKLEVDIDDLILKIKRTSGVKAILMVHYWGFKIKAKSVRWKDISSRDERSVWGGYPFSHLAGVDLPQAIVNWLRQNVAS